jgi:multiphosphoryl transfer protein
VTRFAGRPAAPGIALGRLVRVDRAPSTVDGGVSLPAAFGMVAEDLGRLAVDLRAAGREEAADIVETNRLIVEDPDLRAAVDAAIAAGAAPAAAISTAVAHYAGTLEALPDATLAARGADVRAVGRRLLAALAGPAPVPLAGPRVVAAHEVAADDLLAAGTDLVGAVSVLGGGNAHASIVARALGVPLVVGIDETALRLADGVELVVDGGAGTVVAEPNPNERRAALAAAAARRDRDAALASARDLPVTTRDGLAITVLANVGSTVEADLAVAAGAVGIGLLRTEMPFLTATHAPTCTELSAALTPILRRFPDQPVTVRTLDFAPDKLPPFLVGAPAAQPLDRQFAAILATGHRQLRIMIPMVRSAAEFAAHRQVLAAQAAGRGIPPLGAMVELPVAVEDADRLAAVADFLSLGTNDLTAAMLGLDRRDPALTPARAAEPAILGAIAAVVAAGAAHGTPVSVCGDAAADPLVVPLLVGVGCTSLSVAPAALDEVRALVRSLDAAECATRARAVLAGATGPGPAR